jgi:hypothetical protein
MRNSKSTLAKLLAKENIEIIEGSFRTASFDVINRVLRLPLLKYMSDDVTDLMQGHEVGHALFTPSQGWHDSVTDVSSIPRSYLNIVEDIRIERLIQAEYPGLVGPFKRGYRTLFENNFFDTKGRSLDSYRLPDRINIKAKLVDLVPVPFYEEEQEIVDQCFRVKTWEDVVEAAKALYEFDKESQEEEPEETQTSNGETSAEENETDPSAEENETDSEENETDPSAEENETDSEENETDPSAEENETDSEENETDPSAEESSDPSEPKEFDPTIETEEAFRNNESNLLETDEYGYVPTVIRSFSERDIKNTLVSYKEVFAGRDKTNENFGRSRDQRILEPFKKFLNETKKTVNIMVREFESKKSARRYAKAKTSRSGTLDMKKLHSYKFNDDIFARNLVMEDDKNHGMLMYVDYSGSMKNTLGAVLKQIINLVMFCDKVKIPFKVIGFTNNSSNYYKKYDVKSNISPREFVNFELFSSEMSKSELNRAIEDVFFYDIESNVNNPWVARVSPSEYETLGGTPLDATIITAITLAKMFKRTYNIDKLNTIFLTDGDSHPITVDDDNGGYRRYYNKLFVNIDGKKYQVDTLSYKSDTTRDLLKIYKDSVGGSLIGYFIPDSHKAVRDLFRTAECNGRVESAQVARREYNKHNHYEFTDFKGYDTMFAVRGGRDLDTDNDEFDVIEGAKKGEILRKFKKFAGSKKSNRILTVKFAEAVA